MPTPDSKRRWYRLSPDRFVISLLVVICLLWLSDRFQWFGFNHRTGWTVLIAVVAVGMAALVMLLWWATGLIFGWRFQFGIRTVLTFCLACSIAAGWLAGEMRQARRQAETVAWLVSSGRMFEYDWQVDSNGNPPPLPLKPEQPGPGWLRNLLGTDFLSAVATIGFGDTNITDDGLDQLKNLTGVRNVWIERFDITDAGLEHIKSLRQLETLSLSTTQVTDAGLEVITSLSQLRWLCLSGTRITNAGLEKLNCLPRLETLVIDATQITDAGLEHLEGFAQLHILVLENDGITDAGLEHLKGLTQLAQLVLSGTQVTETGVKNLQRSLPNCNIYH